MLILKEQTFLVFFYLFYLSIESSNSAKPTVAFVSLLAKKRQYIIQFIALKSNALRIWKYGIETCSWGFSFLEFHRMKDKD